jgi:hypothetical protein
MGQSDCAAWTGLGWVGLGWVNVLGGVGKDVVEEWKEKVLVDVY